MIKYRNKFEPLNPMYTNEIKEVIGGHVKTIEIDHEFDAVPGQFVMVWVPGKGEVPLSIGNDEPLTLGVANKSSIRSEIYKLDEGDVISYRGPFGNPFSAPKDTDKILVVGGGYGTIPLYFLSKEARKLDIEVYGVIGAKTENEVVWGRELFQACNELFITTEDGSQGKKGTVMEELKWLIEEKEFDMVYTVGPEKMMYKVAKLCKKSSIGCQVSIERPMESGFGLSGSSDIGGYLCSVDGPVFTGEEALGFKEFGE